MHVIRHPAVAGAFYPNEADELRAMTRDMLSKARRGSATSKAVIVPHAGYVYSGPIAASAYSALTQVRDIVRRVVLMGPSHRVAFQGLAVSHADVFATPLGHVPVDRAAIQTLAALPQVRFLDEAHWYEHSLEVQLPFLQELLAAFTVIPVVVGDAGADEVAEAMEAVWGDAETLVVVSSDLSHYHDYDTARELDAATSQAIEQLRPEDIRYEHACGRNPVNGLLSMAKRLGLQGRTVDLRSSGDTAGPRDQVVGYGAYVFN